MKLEYSGKNALILGGSCEIGCILAKKMRANGLYPILSYKSRAGQERISTELMEKSIKVDAFPLDFTNPESALSVLEEKISTGVDFLVDFAQSDYESLVASASDTAVINYFNANISFRALAVKRVSRDMLKQKRGRLIFISSLAANRPNPGQGFYAAAKLASEAVYKNIGIELGAKGVTSLVIRPGYVNCGRGKSYLKNNATHIKKQIPTGLVVEPADVADAIMFFLSDCAGQFNATEVTLDGGFNAGKTILM